MSLLQAKLPLGICISLWLNELKIFFWTPRFPKLVEFQQVRIYWAAKSGRQSQRQQLTNFFAVKRARKHQLPRPVKCQCLNGQRSTKVALRQCAHIVVRRAGKSSSTQNNRQTDSSAFFYFSLKSLPKNVGPAFCLQINFQLRTAAETCFNQEPVCWPLNGNCQPCNRQCSDIFDKKSSFDKSWWLQRSRNITLY